MRIVLIVFCLLTIIVELDVLYNTQKRKGEYEKEHYKKKMIIAALTVFFSLSLILLAFRK